MAEISINFLAVVAAAIANMVIGAIWYSPAVFGKMWMKSAGISQKDVEAQKKAMQKVYGFAFVGALIMAYVFAIIINLTAATTVVEALQIGFLAWLGFVATVSLSSVLFEGRKQELYLLNNGYNLISLLVMSLILVLWI